MFSSSEDEDRIIEEEEEEEQKFEEEEQDPKEDQKIIDAMDEKEYNEFMWRQIAILNEKFMNKEMLDKSPLLGEEEKEKRKAELDRLCDQRIHWVIMEYKK